MTSTAWTPLLAAALCAVLSACVGKASPVLSGDGVLAGVAFTPDAVKGGATSTLRISLNAAQPTDVTVAVALGDPGAALAPASLVTSATVGRGQLGLSLTVATVPVAATATVTAVAAYGGVIVPAATLTVDVPALASLTTSTAPLVWWDASHVTTGAGTVTLDAAAAATTTVYLSSSDSILAIPARISVPPGQQVASFVATPGAAVTAVAVTVNASLTADLAVKRSATFQLRPALSAFALSATLVPGGTLVKGTVTLAAAAPSGGFTVVASADGPRVSFASPNVTVAAGQTAATFDVLTVADPAPATVNVSVAAGGVVKSVALLLTAPALQALALTPPTANAGDLVTGTVTLSGAALGRTRVDLSTSDATATPGLGPVYVATGATTATFGFAAGSVATQRTATVSATLNGVARTAQLTVRAAAPACTSFTCSAWGTCTGGVQTRTVLTASPAGCTGGSPLLSQACTPVAVTVSPRTLTLDACTSQPFTATVANASNQAVTWSAPDPSGGTVTTGGVYTAPGAAGTYHLVATSVADPTASDSAVLTVQEHVLSVAVSPDVVTVVTGQIQVFTAIVTTTCGVVTSSASVAGP